MGLRRRMKAEVLIQTVSYDPFSIFQSKAEFRRTTATSNNLNISMANAVNAKLVEKRPSWHPGI